MFQVEVCIVFRYIIGNMRIKDSLK